MRVLFFLEPVIFRGDPEFLAAHFFWADAVEASVRLVGGTLALAANPAVCEKWCGRAGSEDRSRMTFAIDPFEPLAGLGYSRANYSKALYGAAESSNALIEALRAIRRSHDPDIVVMTSQNNFARRAFDGLPVLSLEQAPLPRLGQSLRTAVDPDGHQTGAILERRVSQIKSLPLSPEAHAALRSLLTDIERNPFRSDSRAVAARAFLNDMKLDGPVALLVTQPPDWVTYEGALGPIEPECLLYSWAQSLPAGWTGVPTYHPGFRLGQNIELALAASCPRLRFLPPSLAQGLTEALLPVADGMITLSSTSAMTALLLGKRVVVVGRSPFNVWTANDPSRIDEAVCLPPHEAESLLAFLTNRFSHIHDDLVQDPRILADLMQAVVSTPSPADWFMDMSAWSIVRARSLFQLTAEDPSDAMPKPNNSAPAEPPQTPASEAEPSPPGAAEILPLRAPEAGFDEVAHAEPDEPGRFIAQFVDAIVVPEGETKPESARRQAGFVGRNIARERPALNIFGDLPLARERARFKVICFYTSDNEYAAFADRLRASLRRFCLDYELEPIQSLGAWEMNCAHKPRFIKEKWMHSDIPVVWLDADATVEADPELFGQIHADFAMHKWDGVWDGQNGTENGWEFCSGTLYFGKSELTGLLLDQWILRCDADPLLWDQIHLSSAWCDISSVHPLKTVWLPRSYLQISGGPEASPPIVKHWQASRALKADGRALHASPYFYTKEGKSSRAENRLWRTAEEVFWIGQGTAHIKPEIGHDFPEGFDVGQALRTAIGGHFPVLEVGCGVGRIASLFDAAEYVGIDLNPTAVMQARALLPSHHFGLTDHGIEYPPTPTALAYTVLLHIADDALVEFLRQIVKGRSRLVVAELMDSRWRRAGNPPVFNRNPEDYVLVMSSLGFQLSSYAKHAYTRYQNQGLEQDVRITFLTFEPMAGHRG